jgi:hypothetical protein
MTDRMRRRWGAAALLASLSLLAGCIDDAGDPPEPVPQASATPTSAIRLGDIAVGAPAIAQRAGLYLCDDRIVASAPAGGIELDSFVVFKRATGTGEITEVKLPRRLRPNARWLLTTQCVDPDDGEPFISVAYQEMPLSPTGGSGIRAAYSLDGKRLWMRDDLNQPGMVVDDVLVLGSAPGQPETAVDLSTGRTVATFDPAVQSRTVVSGNRMVVRGLSGPPVLTTLTGRRVATLRPASLFTAAGGLLFAITPAALPDAGEATEEDSDGLTDASPSPSPTESVPPEAGSPLPRGEVHAYSLHTGRPLWDVDIAPDPLGAPTVDAESGIAVVMGVNGVAHGVNVATGAQEWRAPTELDNPRVTAAGGIVMFDRVEDPQQLLVDARTGLRLPEQEDPIVDLSAHGALQIVDGVARVVPLRRLRTVPTSAEETFG